MSEKKKRRQLTTDQKVAILKQHLVDKVPVSTRPTKPGPNRRERQLADQVAALEAKLAKKDSVIAEISAEYVGLTKELGEL